MSASIVEEGVKARRRRNSASHSAVQVDTAKPERMPQNQAVDSDGVDIDTRQRDARAQRGCPCRAAL